ncbi:S-methyl-5-thioribose-1-phosphate isomerase [Bradymonas sediminis]|nr:S-methyl-5-thioribose-1-phosphate isomerase [Bradymonas sediminis]TDP76413.1 methylthioribose-1-phosphate isomerase [Bradymonas sediminis]
MKTVVAPLRWIGEMMPDGRLEMLDQRRLPAEEVWLPMPTYEAVADGIREMAIRGAPAIGIAAAYGVALAARAIFEQTSSADGLEVKLAPIYAHLAETRPTAVNLFWALERMKKCVVESAVLSGAARVERLFEEAAAISKEDRDNNERMGRLGADLFGPGTRIMTHCNTGGLATGGLGTAIGIIRALHHAGKLEHVWIGETRPYLQGARLTTWECQQDQIPSTLITDSMAAHFMQQGKVDAVIVGADRVAANGDVANKIGTYGLAVLCGYHKIPFYVAAPISTIDMETPSGEAIEIEQRSPREVTHLNGMAIAPEGMDAASPAFDMTPSSLIRAIITEDGILEAPYDVALAGLLG